jgi:hypothetical protein
MPNKKRTLRESGLVMVGARLPVELHRKANHYRVDNDLSMKQLLELALIEYIEKDRQAKRVK